MLLPYVRHEYKRYLSGDKKGAKWSIKQKCDENESLWNVETFVASV